MDFPSTSCFTPAGGAVAIGASASTRGEGSWVKASTTVRRALFTVLLFILPTLAACGSPGSAGACLPGPDEPAWLYTVAPNDQPNLHVALDWIDTGPTTSTLPSPDRASVGDAYRRAWLQWNLSFLQCRTAGLDRYFGGPALKEVEADVGAAERSGNRVVQADTRHRLRVDSVSPDGSVVRLTDEAALVVRIVRTRFGAEVSARETESVYQVEMTRAGGQWRVLVLARRAVRDAGPSRPLSPLRTPPHFIGVRGTSLVVDGQPLRLAGYNYFPESTPWLAFWKTYDTRAIDRDLSTIEAQGLNAIRVLIPYDQFGGASPDPKFIERLADFLSRARVHHLRVLVALFDFHDVTSPLLWAGADRQLEALLRRFTDDSTIIAWDLRNEPNIFYPADSQRTIDAWLTHLARLARAVDPHHPLTIGWFRPEEATRLSSLVDVVSYHYYGNVADFARRFDVLRKTVSNKPILLSEFGRTTFNPLTFLGFYDEADQARYYRDVIGKIARSDSVGYLVWTLHDFPSYPPGSWWPQPWQLEVERHFGVLRWDGTGKPAYPYVRPLDREPR